MFKFGGEALAADSDQGGYFGNMTQALVRRVAKHMTHVTLGFVFGLGAAHVTQRRRSKASDTTRTGPGVRSAAAGLWGLGPALQ